jgi:RHS repeat-associated protein
MRKDGELTYLHGDHLGSTSLATHGSGARAGQEVPGSRATYYPYGELRTGSAEDLPTDYGFTGQRNDSYIKLLDYVARRYDPQIGRFISPDTIVPDPANPQSLNRYTYVVNNPVKYVDPSGHAYCVDAECKERADSNTGEIMVPPCTPGYGGCLGPPYPTYEQWQAIYEQERFARIERIEHNIALGINILTQLINIFGGMASVYNTPAMGSPSALQGYGGMYYPEGQVGAAYAIESLSYSPYQVPYDPSNPGQPDSEWSIDTRGFPSGNWTERGGIQNRSEFWKLWLDIRPETLSPNNQFRIEALDLSPKVDSTWVEYFPQHADYMQDTLFHHHVGQGPYAIPVPGSTHRGYGPPWHDR